MIALGELKAKNDVYALGNFYIDKEKYSMEEVSTIEDENGRQYVIEGEKYPSITTILGYHKRASLKRWEDRIGSEAATRIKNMTSTRGTELHTLAEDYLNNQKVYYNRYGEITKRNFLNLKPALDSISVIHMQEQPLLSKKHRVAGRVDLIADYLKYTSILDFKSSTKPKNATYAHSYFLQIAGYSVMAEEQFGLKADKGVILLSVNDAPKVKEFNFDIRIYKEEVKDAISRYHADHPTKK